PGPHDKVPKSIGHFRIQPLKESLTPHLATLFPDIYRHLLDVACTNSWERECLAREAALPRKPIDQIIAEVDQRDSYSKARSVAQFASDEIADSEVRLQIGD